jgi:hypothetical protein
MRWAALAASTLDVPVTKLAKVSDGSRPIEARPSVSVTTLATSPTDMAVAAGARDAVIGGGGIARQAQFRHGAAARMHRDAHMAHVARDFPGQRQAIGKAIGHPVGGEFVGR